MGCDNYCVKFVHNQIWLTFYHNDRIARVSVNLLSSKSSSLTTMTSCWFETNCVKIPLSTNIHFNSRPIAQIYIFHTCKYFFKIIESNTNVVILLIASVLFVLQLGFSPQERQPTFADPWFLSHKNSILRISNGWVYLHLCW